jgi:hypothetical protein
MLARPTLLALVAHAVVLAAAPTAHAQCASAAGSCLVPHTPGGCDDPACCTAVCQVDPTCCGTAWDADCVLVANQICIGLCGADVNGSCLAQHDTPGCDDEACCNEVCIIDSFCCDVRWDFACALSASLNCDLGGGGTQCGNVDAGSCFEAHPNPACDDAICCNAVCAVSPTCCDIAWDVLCASIAKEVCIGPCQPTCPPGTLLEIELCGENTNDPCYNPSPSPFLQTLPADGAACGRVRVVAGPNGLVRDFDVWNVVVVDGDGDGLASVQISLGAAFQGFAVLLPATGCAPLDTAITFVNSAQCVEASSEAVCVAPGTYRVVVVPGTFPSLGTTLIDCGDSDGYILRAIVSDLGCSPPCSPTSGPCFQPHKGAGCSDVACCEATCAQDPFCCEFGWDQSCADKAIALCAPVPGNNGCAGAFPIALGNTAISTIGATSGPLVPAFCIEAGGQGPGFRDVWYRFTPTASGAVTATTCGFPSTFNSALAVYTGNACTSLVLLGCDDTAAGICFPPEAASVTFTVQCGANYWIRVGGGWGTTTLSLTQPSGVSCTPPCPADLDGNNDVGAPDLAILLGAWGNSGGPADLDGNGSVGAPDLAVLLGEWGPC